MVSWIRKDWSQSPNRGPNSIASSSVRKLSSTSGVISVLFWIMPDCTHHMLAHIKDRQHDIEGVRQIITATKVLNTHFKNIHVNFMEVVAFYEHLYQLISHYKSEDDPGDWQDGSFRDLSYHGKRPRRSSPPGLGTQVAISPTL